MTKFIDQFIAEVKRTPEWNAMENTHEDSPWHREFSVARHTEMCIEQYLQQFAPHRNYCQQVLSIIMLVFHDFGKPEAEETLEKKDEPGVFFRRYAGHEPISGNVFMNFMCDNHTLREMFFAEGFDWKDLRKVKFMIEHHLPYGLKNVQKRADLRQAVHLTLGDDEVCFWDVLRSDAAGRISDDHATKLANVETWITEFQVVTWKEKTGKYLSKYMGEPLTLYVLVGCSGVGKSTWTQKFVEEQAALPDHRGAIVMSEDTIRVSFTERTAKPEGLFCWEEMSEREKYAYAWHHCTTVDEAGYKAAVQVMWKNSLGADNIVLDRMNLTKKARGSWILAAKQAGYRIVSVEFFASEKLINERQKTRTDKFLPQKLVHQFVMSLSTPLEGSEVDSFIIVPSAEKELSYAERVKLLHEAGASSLSKFVPVQLPPDEVAAQIVEGLTRNLK